MKIQEQGFAISPGKDAQEPSGLPFLRLAQIRKVRESLGNFHYSTASLIEPLIVERASDRESLEAALSLLENGRVASDLETPSPTGLWCPIQLALPEAAVIVARAGRQIIGAMAVIQDTPIGLPADLGFEAELKRIRARGERLVEITPAAIHPSWRGHGDRSDRAVLELFKYAYHYSSIMMGTPTFVMRAHPVEAFSYEAILGFTRAGTRPFDRSRRQALSVLDLARLPRWGSEIYRAVPAHRDPVAYVIARPGVTHRYPARAGEGTLPPPVMNRDLLKFLFEVRTDAFVRATKQELELVHSAYVGRFPLAGIRALEGFAPRPYRHSVNLPITLRAGGATWMGRIFDLSEGGLYFEGEIELNMDTEYEAAFQIGNELVRIRAKPRWSNRGLGARHPSGVGFQFLERHPRLIEAVKRTRTQATLRDRAQVVFK